MAGDSDTPTTQRAEGRNPAPVNGAAVRRPRPPGPNDVQPSSSKGAPPTKNPLMRPRPCWQTLLLSFGPTLLLIGIFFYISTRAASQLGGSGGPFGLGRSRAKRYDQAEEGAVRITFVDVAGIDEAKAELEEIVDFL